MENKVKSNKLSPEEKQEELRKKRLAEEVRADFEKRRADRLFIERQWEMNANFLTGNQYVGLDGRGDLVENDKEFFWQEKGVFNHVAPIIETRLAKLSRVSPIIAVRAKSDDDTDVTNASLAEKLISDVFKKNDMDDVVRTANSWSETCGTAFYKIIWQENGGAAVGETESGKIFEGDVEIIPVSPFEIFPENLTVNKLSAQKSIIHARALSVGEIKSLYGETVSGEDDVLISPALNNATNLKQRKKADKNYALVIEKYFAPTEDYPDGRLVTVAGGKVLFEGSLPYVNGDNGKRTFPFVKQEAITVPGNFFGKSIIERLIPVQRAYNAVKNRKHEFLNRLTTGVMTVEDGAVDVDDLSSDGLSPGKVLVYRQGAKAPEMMKETALPPDFADEEDKLINEFVTVSGISDVASNANNARVSSGKALELLIEQDNERLTVYAEAVRKSYIEVAKQSLRLYAQFISGVRAIKYRGQRGKTETAYVTKSVAASDDVYLENENELIYTQSQKKDMIFKLYESGLLLGDDGRLRPSTKEKVLSLLGYKELDYRKGVSRLQEDKAMSENEKIRKEGLPIEEIDDDRIHVDEHIRYVLSEYHELSAEEKERLFAHVKAHKERLAVTDNYSSQDVNDNESQTEKLNGDNFGGKDF